MTGMPAHRDRRERISRPRVDRGQWLAMLPDQRAVALLGLGFENMLTILEEDTASADPHTRSLQFQIWQTLIKAGVKLHESDSRAVELRRLTDAVRTRSHVVPDADFP